MCGSPGQTNRSDRRMVFEAEGTGLANLNYGECGSPWPYEYRAAISGRPTFTGVTNTSPFQQFRGWLGALWDFHVDEPPNCAWRSESGGISFDLAIVRRPYFPQFPVQSLRTVTAGEAIDVPFTVANFGDSYQYADDAWDLDRLEADGLPPGLALELGAPAGLYAKNYRLAGIPANPGSYSVTLFAENAGGTTATNFTMVVQGKPLTVQSLNPSNGQNFVTWTLPFIEAEFSEDIDPSSVASSTFLATYARGGSAVYVCNQYGTSFNRVRLTNESGFTPIGDVVTVRLRGGTNGIRSVYGNTLAQHYKWSFSTMPSTTVNIVAAQAVDGEDWVVGKPGAVRVLPTWGEDGYSGISAVTGKVTLFWEDLELSYERPEMGFRHWDSQTDAMPPEGVVLGDPAFRRGNAAVFSSYRGEVPIVAAASVYKVSAMIEYGEWMYFAGETNVTVKNGRRLSVHYLPLQVNSGGYVAGASQPAVATFAAAQSPWIKRFFPIAGLDASRELVVPSIYSLGATIPMGDLSNEQLLQVLARDMDAYRQKLGRDVVVGVVPDGWLQARAGTVVLSGVHACAQPGLDVAFVEAGVLNHVTAHALGQMFAYPSPSAPHSQSENDFRGFDPLTESRYAEGVPYFAGDFMAENATGAPFDAKEPWVNRETYRRLMDVFVEGGAAPERKAPVAKADPVPVLAVRGLLLQSGGTTTALVNQVYALDSHELSASGATGDYYAEAFNASGTLLTSLRFDPAFAADGQGRLFAIFEFYFPNPSQVARVAIRQAGTQIGTFSRPATPPDVAIVAPAAGANVTGALTVQWNLTAGTPPVSYSVYFRPDAAAPWSILSYNQTNRVLVADGLQIQSGSNCQVKVAADDGFNQTAATSGVFRVSRAPAVAACTPSHLAQGVAELPRIQISFSDALRESSVAANSVRLLGPDNEPIACGRHYDPDVFAVNLVPDQPLRQGYWHTVEVGTNVLAQTGQPLAQTYSSLFRTAASSEPPDLAMTRIAGSLLKLFWLPSEFSLKQTTNLVTGPWTTPAESPQDDGTNAYILISPTAPRQFYRLQK